MRKFFDRIPLKFINYVFWLLLIYLIAALGWWYIELDQQNDLMLAFQLEPAIKNSAMVPGAIEAVQDAHNRNAKQYIGEGLTFLIITILGAVFVYSVVRRQIRFHLQQKNFMMAVTHELKTPIAVTKLNLETLRRHKLDEARQSKILGDAINETERLDSLCNNILLSSQLESGGYQLTKQEFDCAEMLSSAVSAFQKRYPARSFALEVSGPVVLNGEEFLIRLVLNNLIENAVKYIHNSNGRVIITGIGKCALIAIKIVASFNSTGTPAIYMHAADAILGDLRTIQKNDIVVCISKSGNTPEIKVLVPFIKNDAIVGIITNSDLRSMVKDYTYFSTLVAKDIMGKNQKNINVHAMPIEA